MVVGMPGIHRPAHKSRGQAVVICCSGIPQAIGDTSVGQIVETHDA
jgi:hypothetical protein